MSIDSQYTFFGGFFNGLFTGNNTKLNADQPFSESFSGITLTIHRPNAEVPVDLGALIATNANTGLVANKLISAGASLTSGLRVQGVPWLSVPYFLQNLGAHKIMDMLVRVDFDFHIETPWYCSDIDGNISVYLFLFLDAKGHLKGKVDGQWFTFDGGGPFCRGPAQDALMSAVPGVSQQVKPILDQALATAASGKFKQLYFLPGNGTKTPGVSFQNASNDLALGLIPG